MMETVSENVMLGFLVMGGRTKLVKSFRDPAVPNDISVLLIIDWDWSISLLESTCFCRSRL